MKVLLTLCLLQLATLLSAQTYHLEQVNTIVNNSLYVFMQDGDVMSNSLINQALQTTNDFQTEQLTGQESYVWKLINTNASSSLYKLQNCSLESTNYLTYNKQGLSFANNSKATQWQLNFQSDGTLVILTNDKNRSLAYSSATSHQYKLYSATTDLKPYDENPGYITVYQLVSDTSVNGISDTTISNEAPTIYYDLQGRPIRQPHNHISKGLLITKDRKKVVQ